MKRVIIKFAIMFFICVISLFLYSCDCKNVGSTIIYGNTEKTDTTAAICETTTTVITSFATESIASDIAQTEATTAATDITEATSMADKTEFPNITTTENLWFSRSSFYNFGSIIISTNACVEYYDCSDGRMYAFCFDDDCKLDCFAMDSTWLGMYLSIPHMDTDDEENTLYYCNKHGCIFSVCRDNAERKLIFNARDYSDTISLIGAEYGKGDVLNIQTLSAYDNKLIFKIEETISIYEEYTGKHVWLCYDMQTEKLTDLSENAAKINENYEIICFFDGEIYLSENDKNYKCDLQMNNIVETAFVSQNDGIYTDCGMYYYDYVDNILYMRDYITGNDEALFTLGIKKPIVYVGEFPTSGSICANPFVMNNGKIYFTYSGKEISKTIGTVRGRAVKNGSGGKLYCLDVESGIIECIIDDIMLDIASIFLYGDKLIVCCEAYCVNGEGQIEKYVNIIRNHTTTDTCYLEFELNSDGEYINNGFIHEYSTRRL